MYKKFETKLNRFIEKIQPVTMPTLTRGIVYLLIPTYLLISLNKGININLPQIPMVYIKFLIALIGVTYGYKDIESYIKNVNNFSGTIKVSAKLFLLEVLFMGVILFLVGRDPQNLKDISISNFSYYKFLLELPFTAIGEEVLKVLTLFAFIRICKPFKNKRVIIAIIATATIFGSLHINYSYTNAIRIIIAIGGTAIPSLIFFLYYKSIYPCIIVHFIHDLVAVSYYTENYSWVYLIFQIIVMIIFLGGLFKYNLTKNDKVL